MKKSIALSVLLGAQLLQAGLAIVPGDEQYYKKSIENPNIEMIYTEQTQYAAKKAMEVEAMIHASYEDTFGYKLDAPLHVGIISQRNQEANGFSTQVPLNMQINYIGGTSMVDYFTSTSWVEVLMYHETAHNYQGNPKASAITRGLHSVLGNSNFTLQFFPLFAIPNSALPSFPLEGNSVLNESWHGNGGRLYSGNRRALVVEMAKKGKITPQFLWNNNTHEFPYGEENYIVGGFFQLYLAQRYGLKKVNSFFYNNSKSWLWPFRTNHISMMTFGKTYEELIKEFNEWILADSTDFVAATGEKVAVSQYYTFLNRDKDEVFFITNDAQYSPELVKVDKKEQAVTKEHDSYRLAKALKVDGEYYTQSFNFVNPTLKLEGLFDKDAQILEGTESKMIQGYLKDKTPVYFDVASSFVEPQLYVGDTFYSKTNSSVIIDKNDNLYYFVQEGKKRTLYKNKTPLYTFNDYYAYPSDVDEQGRVYFVANSKKGSSLYRFYGSKAERVSSADNIFDARLLDDKTLLIEAVGGDNYYFVKAPIETSDEAPTERKIFFEDKPYFNNASYADAPSKATKVTLDTETPYYGPTNLHYSGTSLTVGSAQNNGEAVFTYDIKASFADPLLTNEFTVFANQGQDKVGIAGIGYTNNAHILEFGANIYGVYDDGNVTNTYYDYNISNNTYSSGQNLTTDPREFGVSAYVKLPILANGYNAMDATLSYYQDYDSNQRSPLLFNVSLSHAEIFGEAIDYNYLNHLTLFSSLDRGDVAVGGTYKLAHSLPWKSFLSASLKGVASNYNPEAPITDEDRTRGVKFSPYLNPTFSDPTTVVMQSLKYTRYVKQAAVGDIKFKKQFDGRILFFTFPFSLTREVVYLGNSFYDIQDFGQGSSFDEHTQYNETYAGLELELLLLNKITIPVNFTYYSNDSQNDTDSGLRFNVGFSF